jgi:signal transduction histidine kinase
VTTFNDTIARLEKLFATQRRFVADIGHELRTPLTVIRGNVDLMRKVGIEDEESLHSIELEVQRLSRLVEDLLILAQAESGKLPMDHRRVEMDTVLLEVCNHANVLSAGRVMLEIGEIDQVLVCGDRDRLKQVALNLMANAVKYSSDDGKVLVTLNKDRERMYLRVEDDGPGIPEEDLPHIFERFYRGDRARHRQGQEGSGFGLGLSIAYWIVRTHQGQIEVQSQVGQGTTFTVVLPLAAADCPEDTRELTPISIQPERIS